ncbi:YraN family protein [Phaeovulum sp.]|uniref:YraN family protein n=1 Tax=Phaeovulum sp. TaxID=2934796 RepID=UPI0039E2F797
MSGAVSYHGGLAAEAQVAAHYQRSGKCIAARRWRGTGGEIDLVARDGDAVVFIEVKKSTSHARAVERLSRRQMDRIYASAGEFIAGEPAGQMTEVRFDVALVDSVGRIEILENAFGFD